MSLIRAQLMTRQLISQLVFKQRTNTVNMLWLILIAIPIIYFIFEYAYKPTRFWRERNVPHRTPFPIVGNMERLVLRRENFFENVLAMYNDFPDKRYFGVFQFITPALVIRDLELIKQIAVKDFDHFTNRRNAGELNLDVLFTKNLAQLRGDEWKAMRDFLSPSFTGSKMKQMFVLMSACAKQIPKYFDTRTERIIELDIKDMFTRYTNDVIATCAFGIQCDSLTDRTNEFFMMGKDATNFSGWRGILFLLLNFCPSLLKVFRIRVFPEYISRFFTETIQESIRYRLENKIVRPDMVHLLLEARKSINEESPIKELTDIDIAAQAFIFFFAGFETSSMMLSFIATELAINVDCQERLQAEIDAALEECGGEITYDRIAQMKYMDMVISESMRKWPVGALVDRVCTKDFTIKAEGDETSDYEIKVGDNILFPIYGIHHDEKYYSNPDKFDPERFSDENKANITNYNYMPFGIGPRICIGSRFALLEIKILLVHVLSKYHFVVIDKTSVPIEISRSSFKLAPENGWMLGAKLR